MNCVVIGIGSNINPYENIVKARDALSKEHCVKRISRFLVTKPVGKTDQADFINGVLLIETLWDQDRLRSWLKTVELHLGRKKTCEQYGPRTIDLDILLWNDCIIDPDLREREFLKELMIDLMPEWRGI